MSRLEKRLSRLITRAVRDYEMIVPGDRIMVGLSGGKDSWALLHLLHRLRARAPFSFSVVAICLDQAQPGFPAQVIEDHLRERGYEGRVVFRDTYSIVREKIPEGKTTCSLCSRLRRGILYDIAAAEGASKIALGHHRDDIIETALLNLFYAGQLKAMPPRLESDDGRNTVIRPLAYCPEELIAAYATEQGFPIIPCNLCGSQENLHRQKLKQLIAELHEENPVVKGNMLAALGNVRPSHLLDRGLQDRLGIRPRGSDESLRGL